MATSTEMNSSFLIADTTLKAYYRYETGALTTDSSGEGNTLTEISNPAEVAGKFGGGVDLDSNDAFSRADDADFKPTTNFSVGTWVLKNGIGGTGLIMFQSYSQNTNLAGIMLNINATTGYARLLSAKNTGTVAGTDYQVVTGTTNVADNAWHFVVGTWDGSYLRIYTDGVQEGGDVAWADAPAYAATSYIRIGCRNNTGSNTAFLTGYLDDTWIFNGKALNSSEIESLYSLRDIISNNGIVPFRR